MLSSALKKPKQTKPNQNQNKNKKAKTIESKSPLIGRDAKLKEDPNIPSNYATFTFTTFPMHVSGNDYSL